MKDSPRCAASRQPPVAAVDPGNRVVRGHDALEVQATTHGQGGATQLQHGCGVCVLRLDRVPAPSRRNRKPGWPRRHRGEAARPRSVAPPRQGHSAAVAGHPAARPGRVLPGLRRDIDLGQPELLTLVKIDSAGQPEQSQQGRPGPGCSTRTTAVPGRAAHDVVVLHHPGDRRPAADPLVEQLSGDRPPGPDVPGRGEERERLVQLIAGCSAPTGPERD